MTLSDANLNKLSQIHDTLKLKEQRTDRTTDIVSIFAYLIGVRKAMFLNEHEPPQIDVYNRLQNEKRARIIRNLCLVRTALESNFGRIFDAVKNRYQNIYNLSEYIPQEAVMQLSYDGITVFKKGNAFPGDHIIETNRLIKDRINNCKDLFPTWLNWQYVKDLFVMPDGLTDEGIKAEADVYSRNRDLYPYQVYMNWTPYDCGNILSSDKKFVTLLYEWNHDRFDQLNRVEDAGDYVTGNIYDFLDAGQKIIFCVDCENSDPYNFCAAIESLDEQYADKIEKIILFDDVHTSSAWEILEKHVSVPVEYVLIERLKENKSLVDLRLGMRVSQEFYANHVDSFVLVSSDSDYWAVISSLPEAKFLVMVEHGKCGPDIKAALDENGIFYCYIDEFHFARSEGIVMDSLYREMLRYINENLSFNFNDMFDSALTTARVNMSEAEKKQFFEKHIKPFRAEIGNDGYLQIRLKL